MIYIYDIILNLTDNFYYDFYEWSSNDNLINIKKIPAFRVDSKTLYDFINYKIKIDINFLKEIENKSIFLRKDKSKYNYSLLISNGEKSIGLCLSDNGSILYKSAMLLDEEEETNRIVLKEKETTIKYKKYECNATKLLRCDIKKKINILKEIKKEYSSRNFDKLKYIYYEVYKTIPNNIEYAFNRLIKEIDDNIYTINNIFNSLNIK